MTTLESAYAATLRAFRPFIEAAPLGGKLGRGLRGRRATVDRFVAWSGRERRPDAPLIWLHAPSVGEALMAQATVAALRAERADLQIAFTFFSPSAERVAARVGADVADYLPWDVPAAVCETLHALRPAVLAFVRTEVWPVLSREAARGGVRLAMINAVLPAGSSRLGGVVRRLLAPAYARLDAVGAVAESDARRFGDLGVPAARVRVTGDARFDQVWLRLREDRGGSALAERIAATGPVVVAGSTWPADEARLLPAFAAARARRPLRLVIAPHEPTPRHLAALDRRLEREHLRHTRLSAWEAGTTDTAADVIVVDRVGLLAELYAAGVLAYVGGGFGTDGLHSVIEPAAFARPVLFGPRVGGAGEAERLVAAGGAFRVGNERELAERLLALSTSDAERTRAGEAARGFVQANLGAAKRNAAIVLELIDHG